MLTYADEAAYYESVKQVLDVYVGWRMLTNADVCADVCAADALRMLTRA